MTSGSPVSRAAAIWAAKAALLRLARRVVVVVIEAGFADRHDFGMPRGRDQIGRGYVELFMGVMRMRADRAEHVGKALGDGEQFRLALHSRGNRDHALDPGGAGARDHGVKLRGKIGKIEMAMAVDEHVVVSIAPPAFQARYNAERSPPARAVSCQKQCGACRRETRTSVRPPGPPKDRAALRLNPA